MDVNSSTIIQKVKKFMIQHQMIEAGDHLVVGVSGGADSICLLLVLLKLRDVLDYRISVVHVEHGIRGAEAEQDAEFVRSFCEKHRIQCHICHYQVPEYAHAHGMSEEEAGRVLRYQAFRDEKKKYPGQKVKIAVAHHLQDHAETMLFHLVRGTGIHGLAAIAPVNGDVIRPLLHISRQEIEAYLEQMGQDFCTDATNEMDVYSRNQIRHRVLPVLCEINGCAAEHMYQTAQQLREIGNYLEKQAAAAQETCCRMFADGAEIKKDVFLNLDAVIQGEMLYRLLGTLAGSRKDLTRDHIRQIQELFHRQNGRQIQLPLSYHNQSISYTSFWKFVTYAQKYLRLYETKTAFSDNPPYLQPYSLHFSHFLQSEFPHHCKLLPPAFYKEAVSVFRFAGEKAPESGGYGPL